MKTSKIMETKELAMNFMSMEGFDIEKLLDTVDDVSNEFFEGSDIDIHNVLRAVVRNGVNFVTEITDEIDSEEATTLIIAGVLTAAFQQDNNLRKLIKKGLKKNWSFEDMMVALKNTLRVSIEEMFDVIVNDTEEDN